ncbi:Leucine aminopeptidase 1 [Venturia nashicola]|uniref:Mitochondrial fission process protein 1 n=1 Tax=Venturia nashicola TaxID=86259 RepID=A0A4Z1P795_9PEZI|nr:Leucine aminopeptidase 1 [Venturia nashicola]TLD36305.1 Leucine aminopeptidase 1 [Venturia nashicola]
MTDKDPGKIVDKFDPQIPHVRNEPRPDFSKPPPHAQLPKALRNITENEEALWESMYEGNAPESTESNVRYAGYAARVRTILLSAHRYVAYTSDIGESFRPIAHPWLVRGAYGISWAYIGGDVVHEGYKAYVQNQKILHPENEAVKDEAAGKESATLVKREVTPGHVPAIEDYRAVMVQRAIFQSLASMGLPAFTIHSIVRYSGRYLKDAKNLTLRTYGPIGLGLAAVPALPYLFDEPVEHAVDWTFHTAFKAIGGPNAVREKPATPTELIHEAKQKAVEVKDKIEKDL